MKPRRRSRGILTTLGKVPQKPGRQRKSRSPVRKVLVWMGGVLLGAAALVLLFAFTYVRYGPQEGRRGEAEVTVVGVQKKPAGSAPEVVAAARVTIENEPILIPLTEERRAEVEAGTHLRVEYTLFPRTGRVRVDAWQIEP